MVAEVEVSTIVMAIAVGEGPLFEASLNLGQTWSGPSKAIEANIAADLAK